MINRPLVTAFRFVRVKLLWPLAGILKLPQPGITVILLRMRFKFDPKKSDKLRTNPKRAIGFEEVQEVWSHPYYLDTRSDVPEQFRAIGWAKGQLYTVIFEIADDKNGEYYRLITLWKATTEEQKLYEQNP